jgi:hypothetical protein
MDKPGNLLKVVTGEGVGTSVRNIDFIEVNK